MARILAYRPTLAILAGLALGLIIVHLGLFGQQPVVPVAQRLADAAVIAPLLLAMRRLRKHLTAQDMTWNIGTAHEALVWVLAAASLMAPAAALLGFRSVSAMLSGALLSLFTKVVVVYAGIRLSSRLHERTLVGALRLPVPAASAVVISFGLLIVAGAILLSLPVASSPESRSARPVDALFTAASASCVTGLIVRDTPRDWSLFGQLVILLLIQIGGLGTMTMASVLRMFSQRRSTIIERLVVQDTVAPGASDVARVVRLIVGFTFLCESVGALLLAYRWILAGHGVARSLYEGVFHAISAFCNAGFSVFSNNLEDWAADPIVSLTVCVLIVVGGIGFPVVLDLAHCLRSRRLGRRVQLTLHSRLALLTTALLIVAGIALFVVLEWDAAFGNLAPQGKLLAATFASITPRTAGFDTVAPSKFSLASQWITMALMFIGASPGSTGGGVKTTTLAVLSLLVIGMARGERRVNAMRRSIGEMSRHRAFAIMAMMGSAAFLATFTLATTERSDLAKVLYEVLSALGTVGLSLGITPLLSTVGRLIITLLMYLGRVGPLTLALAVAPPKPSAIEYAQEDVMVG